MSSTTFVDNTTVIYSSWLNDVNTTSYTTVPALSTTVSGLVTTVAGKAASGVNTDITSMTGLNAGGIPVSKVAGAAVSGANADITSLTALTAGGLPNNSVLTADIADANVTPAKLSQPFTSGTKVSASGTAVGFTSIPSWVKRITLMYTDLSTNGTSDVVFRIGNGSYIATGYVGGTMTVPASTPTGTVWSTGALLTHSTGITASVVVHGTITFTLVDSATNLWVINGTANRSDNNAAYIQSGRLALAGALDRVQVATANASDTFDAGSVNIIYE